MAPPTIGPELSSSPSPMGTPTANLSSASLRRKSISSLRGKSTDSVKSNYSTVSRTSSSASIPFSSDDEVEPVQEDGVVHTMGRLHAKRYKTLEFASDLLKILVSLRIPTWASAGSLSPEGVKVFKVSGSLTNAVFFISYPNSPSLKTLLLRIYGPSSSELISRPRELHTLHVLSSRYRIGPRVYGTFENGRVEEYFDSTALTASEIRDPVISGWIGSRMAELHCVDIEAIEETTPETRGENVGWDTAARKNFREWTLPAREVLRLKSVSEDYKITLDFDRFVDEWGRYMLWLDKWERAHGASKRVFAHNDTQYGNLLRRKEIKEGTPEHRQIIVVDFEYAAPNSAAFDIANHFHEWTADYHNSTPHILDPKRYPIEQERKNFYKAYLTHACPPFTTTSVATDVNTPSAKLVTVGSGGDIPLDLTTESQKLEAQVRVWSPASHAMWAVWGLVQAREDLELAAQAQAKGAQPDRPEFDYLGYSLCRVERFRAELKALGL
ncbi:kinase-like protein [Fomitiporia mediterranea MF3/22]|uniref:kinase-like protein n=1 Tax=Fomitiporia mediterranea (strain MF3/22) TaxID=694068 RepID=UPI0004407C91|nr:kinase-like protein [Fomitiporia mediterranea MF3/22]EJD04285.1 kinase-like protein [Fomitiporia mediterranea MF3/22]